MYKYLLLLSVLLVAPAVNAQSRDVKTIELKLRDGDSGSSNGITEKEETSEAGHIRNVSEASITVYPANRKKNTGRAVLLCPGGAYSILAAKHEGSDFAMWLAENGITGVVLKYRLPNHHQSIPLEDAQRAMQLIRMNSFAWQIDPQHVGVAGFSAGGHLASTLLTRFDDKSRPDFGILFYPVVSFDPAITHSGTVDNLLAEQSADLFDYYSNESQVTPSTPPTLLLHSNDDTVVVPENSTRFYEALRENKVAASMYIFPSGGHGWGFNDSFKYHEIMKQVVLDWINNK